MSNASKLQIWIMSAIILLAARIILSRLVAEPLWIDEAWSMWAVRAGFFDVFPRVIHDVHPPSYFVVLDMWVMLVGESEFSARVLSMFVGLLGLSVTYRLGKQLFDGWQGVIAAALLGTHVFFIYQAREARMYMLLMTLTSLSIWGYVRWLGDSRKRWMLILANAALLYTHYYAALVLLTQAIHIALAKGAWLKKWLCVQGWVMGIYLPWVPVFTYQLVNSPTGPASVPIATDLDALRWLVLLVTSGLGGLTILVFLLSRFRSFRNSYFGLVILWLIVTPTALLLLNQHPHYRSVYQIRYISAIVPAFAVIVAYPLRKLHWRQITVPLVLVLMVLSVRNYDWLWSPKSPWKTNIAEQFVNLRHDGEPTLSIFTSEASIEAYYDRRFDFRNRWSFHLKDYSAEEVYHVAQQMDDEPTVWAMLPPELGKSWLAMVELGAKHQVIYRARNSIVLMYGFGEQGDELDFRFGEHFRLLSPILPNPLYVHPDSHLCFNVRLAALIPIAGEYSYGLHLADEKRNFITGNDAGLGFHAAGDPITLNPCIDIPHIPSGDYYLHLVVYNWQTGERLPVLEGGIWWESYLILGGVMLAE